MAQRTRGGEKRRNQAHEPHKNANPHKSSARAEDNARKFKSDDGRRRRPWIWAISGLVVLAAGAGVFWWLWLPGPAGQQAAPVPPLVRAATLETAEQVTIRQTAFVRPRAVVAVTSDIQGRIASVSDDFAIGELVTEDTVLVALETETLEARVAGAEANYEQAQAALAEAQETLERQQTLAEEQFVSEATLEDAQVGLQSAQANAVSARASLTEARDTLEKAEIRAPFDALVTSEMAAVGQLVQPGVELGRLVDASAVELQMGLTPADLEVLGTAEAALGATVALTGTGAGNPPLGTGTVVGINPGIIEATRTVALVIEVPSPFEAAADVDRGRAMKIDELVDVALPADLEGRDVFAVPPEAVKGQDALWRIADGALSRVEIQVLYREEDRTSITGDGLAAGMQVMVSDLPGLLEGQDVRVADANTPVEGVAGEETSP